MSRAQVTRFMGSGSSKDVSALRIDIGQEVCIQCTGGHVNCCLKWGLLTFVPSRVRGPCLQKSASERDRGLDGKGTLNQPWNRFPRGHDLAEFALQILDQTDLADVHGSVENRRNQLLDTNRCIGRRTGVFGGSADHLAGLKSSAIKE